MNNERYNRQMLLPELSEEGQEKLSKARVLLVGVGGLGSPIALYLTGAGVGTLGLVDDDVVSISNLQRQILYSEALAGHSKAECAGERLRALNSEVQIHTYPIRLTADNADSIVASYDIVVDGCDNFATRYLIDDTCARLHKPYVYGAIRGFEGQVSVFHYGDCPIGYRTLYPDEEGMLQMPHPGKAVIGVTPAVTGSVEACEVLKIIAGCGDVLAGKLWTINLLTMQTHLLSLQ